MALDIGRFVWFELVSDSSDTASRFYTEVLPWKTASFELGSGDSYPMINLGEVGIGGFAPLPKKDLPAHWVAYLSVADVDAAAEKVIAAGGESLMDAFDIPGVGRAQQVADPEGGAFILFTSKEGDGDAPSGPGSFHWNELHAEDPATLAKFYEKVFDYSVESMDMPNGKYYVLKSGERPRGGVMKRAQEGAPTHWLPYVEVADADEAVARATRQGGDLLGEITEVPGVGRFGVVRDPLGAALGLIKPAAQ